MAHTETSLRPRDVAPLAHRLLESLGAVILGKEETLEHVVTAYLAGGHVLMEDVPGVGKTMLGRALARSVGGSFRRVQFTPDLLPAEITGRLLLQPAPGRLRVHARSHLRSFAHVALADEINRASPRTQSSLLEGMGETQVTVEGHTHELPQPFFLIATQNPIEYDGTFPLPESQLDRFLMCLSIGYPSPDSEASMLRNLGVLHPIETLQPVTDPQTCLEARQAVRHVAVSPELDEYMVRLATATHRHPRVVLGTSPRGSLALRAAAQARAALKGRQHVLPDDIQAVAPHVLGHRLILDAQHGLAREAAQALVGEIMAELPLPGLA